MPSREDILRDLTHKEDGLDLGRRIVYTLTEVKGLEAARIAKALALVISALQAKDILSEEELDDLLFEVVM